MVALARLARRSAARRRAGSLKLPKHELLELLELLEPRRSRAMWGFHSSETRLGLTAGMYDCNEHECLPGRSVQVHCRSLSISLYQIMSAKTKVTKPKTAL